MVGCNRFWIGASPHLFGGDRFEAQRIRVLAPDARQELAIRAVSRLAALPELRRSVRPRSGGFHPGIG